MKNFLSQTWVVAVIALVILAAVLVLGYKLTGKETSKNNKNQKPKENEGNSEEATQSFKGRK